MFGGCCSDSAVSVITVIVKGRRKFKVMLFDLDDTLYRVEAISKLVKQNIMDYMVTRLDIPQENVEAICGELYSTFGTTVAGLVASGYKIDFDDWHQNVHYGSIPYEELLTPDPQLKELLDSIDIPKYVLTNSDSKHTAACLSQLGITECFQGIFDFEWAMAIAEERGLSTPEAPAVLCKPQPLIYELVAEKLSVELADLVFFDDSMRNIAAAAELGMYAVLVGKDVTPPGASLAITSLHQMAAALPQLFEHPEKVDRIESSVPIAVEA